MSIPAIRTALVPIIKATAPVTVGGVSLSIRQSLKYSPQQPPEIVPCAWLGDANGEVEQAGLEVWTILLPLTVAVHEAGSAEIEREIVEAFMLAVVAQLRGNYTADGTCAGLDVAAFAEGEILLQGKTYRGFTLTLSIEDKFEVASQYAP